MNRFREPSSQHQKAIIEPSRVIEPIDIAEHCVLCFFQEVIAELAHGRAISTLARARWAITRFRSSTNGGPRLAVVHPGVGAPAATARFERVIALGCRKFIVCGGARVLDGAIDVGDIVAPSSAIRDEGSRITTSGLHAKWRPPAARSLRFDAVLRENHHDYVCGKTWTTDSVYRETPQRVNRLRCEGCVVDMEAAAFFAVARFRRVSSAPRFSTGATVWRATEGTRADGIATRCASGCAISPPRPACGCKPCAVRMRANAGERMRDGHRRRESSVAGEPRPVLNRLSDLVVDRLATEVLF